MDTEIGRRTDLALPNPQEPTSAPEIELSVVSLHDKNLLEKAALSPPRQTWLTLLKKELEFLGVTQILISLICFYFGIIVCSVFNNSEFKEEFFSSFKAGYPFWGTVFFAISGFVSVMSERKHAPYLIRGSLGANTVSSIAGGIGIIILIINLKKSSACIYRCRDIYENDICFVASVSAVCISCGKTKILGLTLSKTPSLPFHEHNPFLQPQSHNAVFWRRIPRDVPASFPCPPS
ncbi:high affinity immunoglobulin epsilon receptor subunit beta isoform X2 [Sagmatias obliquidens]|uniref:high affinity immunoglobulin epsilon receptor subunit beta isoform X2 n=1 Tax=Sagmatias obliquidens TaxID=3371155 RepID=UPI000F445B63|nr:high affinity immunoglobulin epsilon receptor subunit beta isoform X2 [Lagenorhynchus obliquidens]